MQIKYGWVFSEGVAKVAAMIQVLDLGSTHDCIHDALKYSHFHQEKLALQIVDGVVVSNLVQRGEGQHNRPCHFRSSRNGQLMGACMSVQHSPKRPLIFQLGTGGEGCCSHGIEVGATH